MRAHSYDPTEHACAGYDDVCNHRKGCPLRRPLRFDPAYNNFFYSVECGETHELQSVRSRLVRCVPTEGRKRTLYERGI